MEQELSMVEKKKSWELVKSIPKQEGDDSINKHKVRLVVKGYVQVYDVDYFDTFASIARLDDHLLNLGFTKSLYTNQPCISSIMVVTFFLAIEIKKGLSKVFICQHIVDEEYFKYGESDPKFFSIELICSRENSKSRSSILKEIFRSPFNQLFQIIYSYFFTD